jgi:hypothetical protein
LQGHIRALLAERGQISVADIMDIYPAEQGLGSLVGYLAIGVRCGVRSDRTERVSWQGLDGVPRSAVIPCIHFVKGQCDGHE